MKIREAVITAASRSQRAILLQTIVAQDGTPKSVLAILADEIAKAGIEDIWVVTSPGDERACGICRFSFVPTPLHSSTRASQLRPRHPVRPSLHGGRALLHLVGDHIYVSASGPGCAKPLVSVAEADACSVSAVQSTRESLLPYFGAVGARRITGTPGVYRVETVIEKPTSTEAEQKLLVPGLRSGHYLYFFGMHVLTPAFMEILAWQLAAATEPRTVTLSTALDELSRHEQYLALENSQRRYDIGSRYGFLMAQMVLALSGHDREDVIYQVLEPVANR